MHILYQGRLDLFTNRGGDTVQIEKTMEELRKLGHTLVFDPSLTRQVSEFDIVHVHQLDWTPEAYYQVKNAKKQGVKVVLSPIHHSELEVLQFERESTTPIRKLVNFFIRSQELRDVVKNLYRSASEPGKLLPTIVSLFVGYRQQQAYALKAADVVVTQTRAEALDIARDFGVAVSARAIHLGVGSYFKKPASSSKRIANSLISVGRLEPRKNQLRLVEAVKALKVTIPDITLTLIGTASPNNRSYYRKVLEAISGCTFITHIESVANEQLPSYYLSHSCCVSISYFETTGLTLLEAALCGCTIVARNGDTEKRIKEYLSDIPSFCEPGDIESIQTALKKALAKPETVISEELAQFYSWASVAKTLDSVYNELHR